MRSTSELLRWIPGSLGRLLHVFLNSAYPPICGPLRITLVARARIGIIGRLDALGRWRQVSVRLETHAGHCTFFRRRARPSGPFVMALPGPAQCGNAGGLAHRLWGLGRLDGIEE